MASRHPRVRRSNQNFLLASKYRNLTVFQLFKNQCLLKGLTYKPDSNFTTGVMFISGLGFSPLQLTVVSQVCLCHLFAFCCFAVI